MTTTPKDDEVLWPDTVLQWARVKEGYLVGSWRIREIGHPHNDPASPLTSWTLDGIGPEPLDRFEWGARIPGPEESAGLDGLPDEAGIVARRVGHLANELIVQEQDTIAMVREAGITVASITGDATGRPDDVRATVRNAITELAQTRANLAEMAGQLEAQRAEYLGHLEAQSAKNGTLLIRLAEVERERDAAFKVAFSGFQSIRSVLQRCIHDENAEHADEAVRADEIARAGMLTFCDRERTSGRPVVAEPRDEPRHHAVDVAVQQGLDKLDHVIRMLDRHKYDIGTRIDSASDILREAGNLLEHGYAPHPSGTADEPTPKWLLDILRCIEAGNPDSRAMARGALAAHGIVVNTPSEHPSGTEGPPSLEWRLAAVKRHDEVVDALARSERIRLELQTRFDAALAASPPDGTAPERAQTEPTLIEALFNYAEALLECGPPDRGFGRDILSILKAHDVQRPPDGMPGEPASHRQLVRESLSDPARCVYVGGEGWVSAQRVCELADGIRRGDPYPWRGVTDDGDLLPTAAIPGEPCLHHGDTIEDGPYPRGTTPRRPAAPPTVPGEPHPAYGPCDALGRNGECSECEPSSLGAAPPTVPGEPPLRERLQDALIDEDGCCYDCGAVAGTHEMCRYCEIKRVVLDAAPPTPPCAPVDARPHKLTWSGIEWVAPCGCRYHPDDDKGTHGGAPHVHRCASHIGGAPVDEAAVRADERTKTERDIAACLFNVTGSVLAEQVARQLARKIGCSDYPRTAATSKPGGPTGEPAAAKDDE